MFKPPVFKLSDSRGTPSSHTTTMRDVQGILFRRKDSKGETVKKELYPRQAGRRGIDQVVSFVRSSYNRAVPVWITPRHFFFRVALSCISVNSILPMMQCLDLWCLQALVPSRAPTNSGTVSLLSNFPTIFPHFLKIASGAPQLVTCCRLEFWQRGNIFRDSKLLSSPQQDFHSR